QVDDLDPLELGDLVQVVVVGHHAGVQGLGQDDQALVHLVDFAQLGQVAVVKDHLHLAVVLHPLQDVQAAPPAVPLQLVRAVGDALEFLEHELGDDQLRVDNPRITNIGNAAVNNYAGIQD